MTRRLSSVFIAIVFCGAMLGTPVAQSKRSTETIDLGVVNGKAVSLPIPAYPQAARAVGVDGVVEIRVVINKRGNVVKASVISGPKPLRRVVIAAARLARFPPSLGDCQTCRFVTGILVYRFTLKDDPTRKIQ